VIAGDDAGQWLPVLRRCLFVRMARLKAS
jgi:hypothetical protein